MNQTEETKLLEQIEEWNDAASSHDVLRPSRLSRSRSEIIC